MLTHPSFALARSLCSDPDRYDPDSVEEGLKQVNCPWVFRKVLKRAAKFIKDVTIKQDDDGIEFAFSIHLFGTTINYAPYGELCVTKNLWGKECKVMGPRPPRGQNGTRYEQFENPGCPEGTTYKGSWQLADNGQTLVWENVVYRPDLDTTVVYTQYLIRKEARK